MSEQEPVYDYDMIVIGSGPAGQRAAIQAAKLNKKVALIEKKCFVGGVSTNTGTIPSKTLREAVIYLTGYRERGVYGSSYTVKENITIADLMVRTDHVIRNEREVMRGQLKRNKVELIEGEASFMDPHALRVALAGGHGETAYSARYIVIAAGTAPTRPASIPFDGESVLISDDILTMKSLPRTLAIVGGGVIGTEYASIFATLGIRVTLIDKRRQLMDFLDEEIGDALGYHLRERRVRLWLGEEVRSIERIEEDHLQRVRIQLESGKEVVTEKVLYSIGRTGATAEMNLAAAGLSADERGRLKVNPCFQTEVPHIYAAGDIIGFPSLASTSMEQGRLAACNAFAIECQSMPAYFPYGIYTIPEISYVGMNEEQLTAKSIPYEVGKALYREIARGQIIGDEHGMLKLLFDNKTRKLLGVHIIGEGASELIHIGQAVLAFGGSVDYFIHTVFNYPTLAECYKVAAFDGVNRLLR